jgi:hypothetical protein
MSMALKPKKALRSSSGTGGLTSEETIVMNHLVAAWDAYANLDSVTRDGETDCFREAIHQAQSVLQARVLSRLYPDYWR